MRSGRAAMGGTKEEEGRTEAWRPPHAAELGYRRHDVPWSGISPQRVYVSMNACVYIYIYGVRMHGCVYMYIHLCMEVCVHM